MGGFLAMILCFLLCASEDIASQGMSQYVDARKGAMYYVPKTILSGALWILLVAFYCVARLNNAGDPRYDSLNKDDTYYAFEVALYVFLAIWGAWFLVHMAKSLGKLCTSTLPYAFLFASTVICALFAIIGVSVGALYPLPVNAFNFIFFYGAFNLYVWILAFAYAPESADGAHALELRSGGGGGGNAGELYENLMEGNGNGEARTGRGMI